MHEKSKKLYDANLLNIGFVQQATKEGCEPFIPAISLYKYGGLAKWAPIIQKIELRLNDPGFRFYKDYYDKIITDAKKNKIGIVLSFPEYKPEYLLAPPERASERNSRDSYQDRSNHLNEKFKKNNDSSNNKNTNLDNSSNNVNKPKYFIWFRRVFLAIPYNYPEKTMCYELTLDECNKILEYAHENQIDKIVIPISEPALFLDQHAISILVDKITEISKLAQKYNINIYLKNGGISFDYLKKICNKINAKMAISLANLYLEKYEISDLFDKYANYCEIFYICQISSGIEEYNQRRENVIKSIISYKKQLENFKPYFKRPFYDKERCVAFNNLRQSYVEFLNSCKSMDFNLLLTQSGKIGFLQFYKYLSQEISAGKQFTIFFETYPNAKNIEMFKKSILPETVI